MSYHTIPIDPARYDWAQPEPEHVEPVEPVRTHRWNAVRAVRVGRNRYVPRAVVLFTLDARPPKIPGTVIIDGAPTNTNTKENTQS